MKNIALKVEYHGAAFAGWQRQANAIAVQQVLEEALEKLLGRKVTVYGAGRTDSGVHAQGQVCSFFADEPFEPQRYASALNHLIPPQVRVACSAEVDELFSPQKDAMGKFYRYQIFNRNIPSPLYADRTWHMPWKLDFELMQQAAQLYVGEHDFASYRSKGASPTLSTVREIWSMKLKKEDELISIEVKGDGFLYNMVRIMAGSIVDVGRGRFPLSRIEESLAAADRERAGQTAPACGLTLMEVYYPWDIWNTKK